MRLSTILREAVLNLAAGTTRAVLFAIVLAIAATGLGAADLITVTGVAKQSAQFRNSGGTTLVYQVNGGINGAACDRLAQVGGVVAAGAVRQRADAAVATVLPAQNIPTYEISSGFGGFTALGGARPTSGVLISDELATALGTHPGGDLVLQQGHPKVGAVFAYPADGRRPGYGYAVLTPTDSRTPFDECWVEGWPVTDTLLSLLPTTLFPGAGAVGPGGQGPQLQQLNSSHGTRFDGAALYQNRITRYAPIAVLLISAGLGYTAIARRRLEFASARHSGVTTPAQTLQTCIESAAWALIAAILTTMALIAIAAIIGGMAASPLWPLIARITTVTVPGVILGALMGTLTIRERHLFTYFKTR